MHLSLCLSIYLSAFRNVVSRASPKWLSVAFELMAPEGEASGPGKVSREIQTMSEFTFLNNLSKYLVL